MSDHLLVAGVDEVGRGPLAGPVVAAAVILSSPIVGLKDSKALSEKRRRALFVEILEHATAWSVGLASSQKIDDINILQASLLAMRRAVRALPVAPAQALVDGNQDPALDCETRLIVGGDKTEPVISAASIVAKVIRDHYMLQLDKVYPLYQFAKHKGYGTAAHMAALKTHGVTRHHRRSFSPVHRCVMAQKECHAS